MPPASIGITPASVSESPVRDRRSRVLQQQVRLPAPVLLGFAGEMKEIQDVAAQP